MDKQRVFFAIPIPETMKQVIARAVSNERVSFKQARWIPEDKWHITVLQPQYWDEDEIRYHMDILQDRIRQAPFAVTMRAVVLGPNSRMPSMIWAVAQQNDDYVSLVEQTQSILSDAGAELRVAHRDEKIIHVTLARFASIFSSRFQWEDKALNESFTVDRMELWHVDLKPTGAEYRNIGTIELTTG